jgi:NDP-sugar pyrophosphorylase family protein
MIKQVVILAGGEGTRLRPVTYEIPKPLVPVQGKPILTWLLAWFRRYGVDHAKIIIAPRWRSAFEAWKETQERNNEIQLIEERQPMGTMGSIVHDLQPELGAEPFFVSNGDQLMDLDLEALTRAHLRAMSRATIGLIQVANPSEYGVVEMDQTRIVRFHEKPKEPPTNLISSGLYLIEPNAFAEVDRSKSFLMFEKDLFPFLAESGQLCGCALEGQWHDCGTMERWEKAIQEWRS